MANDPKIHEKSDLTYNDYLKVPELTALQRPLSVPAHHDEMLFIIIHQAYELWFKLVIHELESARDYMAKRQVLRAHHFVKRVVEIQKLLVNQIHILETMTPVEFLQFRENLMPASGFQSLQHREIEFMCGMKDERYFQYFKNPPEVVARLRKRFDGPDLSISFLKLASDLGYSTPERDSPENREKVLAGLKPIYQDPSHNLPLYLLADSLLDLAPGLSL